MDVISVLSTSYNPDPLAKKGERRQIEWREGDGKERWKESRKERRVEKRSLRPC